MPAPGPARPYQFPAVATRTLANGIQVFVISDHREAAVTAALVLPDAGAVHDPPGLAGVAQLTASLLTQGTATRSAQQIAQAIDFVGGSLSAYARDDDTTAVLTVLKKDTGLGMDLLSDIVLHPSFPPQELERQRQQALSGLRVDYADGGYLASAAFARVVYGSSPYGLPDDGTPQSVARISRDDIERFRQANYAPGHALLAFAGDLTPEEGFAAAEKYFGVWQAAHPAPAPPAAPSATSGLHLLVIDQPDAVQTQIRIGRPGVARNSPDYVPLLVANRIFGGGYNSLLNTAVRLRGGLTYGANSAFQSERFAGHFVAATFTRTEETVPAVSMVVDLIGKMAAGQVTDADLEFARDYLVGVYPIQTETPEQVATRVLTVAEYGLPADENQNYPSRVAAVTLGAVKQMARRYFDAKDLDIVLAGNAAGFRDALKRAFPGAVYEEVPASQLDLLAPGLRRAAAVVPAPTPASLEQGRIALATALDAAGGKAMAGVKNVQATEAGQVSSAQGSLAIDETYQVAYPDRFHSDFTAMGQTLKQIYDGENGWMVSTQGSAQLPPNLVTSIRRRVLLAEGIGVYQAAAAGKMQAQWLGEEQVQGQTLVALEWNSEAGPVKLYLDPQTHLVVGANYVAVTGAGAVDTTELWSDFRTIDGAKLPFHLVAYQAGAKFMEVTVKDLKLNTTVDPALFAAPHP
ncbi:MAG TPA: pitrilysin family protein [Candidatus Acidoferrales bacterium]|nr:pitrilysin family protein [Candidatus Acidoferrales bacterium]